MPHLHSVTFQYIIARNSQSNQVSKVYPDQAIVRSRMHTYTHRNYSVWDVTLPAGELQFVYDKADAGMGFVSVAVVGAAAADVVAAVLVGVAEWWR